MQSASLKQKRLEKKGIDLQLKSFPIVGIGASAGGVQAITALLQNLDANLGMAYVLIMHLSAKHKSSLAKIIRSKTAMKVQTVKDGMKLIPNNVYVIPPDTMMSVVDGHLKLASRSISIHGNFSVDHFFSALASIHKNNAIGVVLSGTATDGTLGLKAIKAGGGITFAQDSTAEFPGMPQHAFDSGYVDFMLSPEDIAKELARLVKVPYTIQPPEKLEDDPVKSDGQHSAELKKILAIVRAKSEVDFFHHYKHASIYRRVVRRMALNDIESFRDYHSFLQSHPKEVDLLYDDFLINVTSFFRDPDFYKTLDNEIFPSVVNQLKDLEPIRIWVAGCSTGEEAYSIAISLMEYLETNALTIPVQIFASDLDADAIEKARLGIYTVSALQGISKSRLKKYFIKVDGHYQIVKSVREVCVFARQNLLKDPPFSRMHLISCQNVLIYLETGPQKKILHTFHYALRSVGYLFLGKSETIGTEDALFESLDRKVKIYRRKVTSPQLDFTIQNQFNATTGKSPVERSGDTDPERVLSKLLLSRFVYPSVVVNKSLMITQFFGDISPYLEPVPGKASFNILKMVREDLVVGLGSLLQHARKTEKPGRKENLLIHQGKVTKEVAIEVVPKQVADEVFFLVVFIEKASPSALITSRASSNGSDQKDKTITQLKEELVQSRGLIRSTNEEYETTYEELQANNEEILSSNEELQSVNEELETSKEELQSAVEELTTTNDELRRRNLELSQSQEELRQVNEQLEQFAFISSHDLQEPLRKILTFSNLLSHPEAELNPFSKKYSEKISDSAYRMSSLLKDLLSFSVLINSDREFSDVDLNDVANKEIEEFQALITSKNAVINVSRLPIIHAEPIQMRQLFHNLISNALNFSTEKPLITISSDAERPLDRLRYPELNSQKHYVSISITDNGIGFEEKHSKKMFSLFQRLNDKKNVDGTGMGLAICKKIVKNHGGVIYATGKKNEGSTFTIFLPVD